MGEAKRRRLRIVEADPTAPFDVDLSPESWHRLASLHSAAVGAAQVAKSAQSAAVGLGSRYEDALTSLYAELGIDPAWHVAVDLDKRKMTVTKEPKGGEPPAG